MRTPRLALILAIANLVAASVTVTSANQDSTAKDTKGTAAANSAALPHDAHDGLTIQADVYTDRARSKQNLGKPTRSPWEVLPVEVTFRNAHGQTATRRH